MPPAQKWTDNPVVFMHESPLDLRFPTRVERECGEYAKLLRHYKGTDAVNYLTMTDEEEKGYCQTLAAEAFRLADIDVNEFRQCFNACVEKCVSTGAVKAQQWSTWGGYRDFSTKMAELAQRTATFGVFHALPATSLVAAMVVKKMRDVDTNGKDDLSVLMLRCRVFAFTHAAIQEWKPGQKIIKTNLKYDGVPLTNEPGTITETVLELSDDDEPELRMENVRQTDNQGQLMYEVQQFEHPRARPRSPTPPAPITMIARKKITRFEAVGQTEDLINYVTSKKWDETKNARLTETLTQRLVAVLPKELKAKLLTFAGMTDNEELKGWLNEATADKQEEEWTETEERPGRPQWVEKGALKAVLDGLWLMANAETDLDKAVRQRLNTFYYQIRHINRERDETAARNAEAKAMRAVDELTKKMTVFENSIAEKVKSAIESAIQKGMDKAFEASIAKCVAKAVKDEMQKQLETFEENQKRWREDDEETQDDEEDTHVSRRRRLDISEDELADEDEENYD